MTQERVKQENPLDVFKEKLLLVLKCTEGEREKYGKEYRMAIDQIVDDYLEELHEHLSKLINLKEYAGWDEYQQLTFRSRLIKAFSEQRDAIVEAMFTYLGEDKSAKFPNIDWEIHKLLVAGKFLSKMFGDDKKSLPEAAPELLPSNVVKKIIAEARKVQQATPEENKTISQEASNADQQTSHRPTTPKS